MQIKKSKYVTDQEFVKLPWKEQHKFLFWYKKPNAFVWDSPSLDNFLSKNRPFNNWAKKHHPIQYWVREAAGDISIQYSIYKDRVREAYCFLFKPYNNIVRKSIPRHQWCDISDLINEVHFAMMFTFEQEMKDFDFVDWESDDAHKEFITKFREYMVYLKEERPILEKKSENYEDIESFTALEKELHDKDSELMTWMIKNRGFMWT